MGIFSKFGPLFGLRIFSQYLPPELPLGYRYRHGKERVSSFVESKFSLFKNSNAVRCFQLRFQLSSNESFQMWFHVSVMNFSVKLIQVNNSRIAHSLKH